MKLSIRSKLLGSFFIIITIFTAFSFHDLFHNKKLADTVSQLVSHPLTVTRSVLKANVGIVSMHRSMKDVVLSKNKSQLEEAINIVNAVELLVLSEFKIIKERTTTIKDQILEVWEV